MESLIGRLIEILEEENRIYGDILDISRRKTNVIVDGKVNELDRLTGTEQQLVLAIGRLEEQREEIVREIAGRMGISREKINVRAVMDGIGGEMKDELRRVTDHLFSTLEELKEVNDLNSQLIRKSLEYIDFSINLLAGSEFRALYSDKKGKKGEDRSFFDQKV